MKMVRSSFSFIPTVNQLPFSKESSRKLPSKLSLCIRPPVIGPSPLEDVRVLLATSQKTASRLCPALIDLGARPFHVRTQNFTSLATEELQQLEEAVLRLSSYDYVLLLSEAAVNSFVSVLLSFCFNDSQAAITALSASEVRLVCLPQIATSVRECCGRLPDIVIPSIARDSLTAFLPKDGSILALTPITDVKNPSVETAVVQTLKEEGYPLTTIPAYRISLPERKTNQVEIDLLARGDIEAVIVEDRGIAVALAVNMDLRERENVSKRLQSGDIVMVGNQGVKKAMETDFYTDSIVELPELVGEKEVVETLANGMAAKRKSNMEIWFPSGNKDVS